MRIYVTLAIVEDVDAHASNDPAVLERALAAGIAAGKFTLLEMTSARFQPQGATAAAIVGESHLAIHTWPEERKLFIDVASCSTRENVRRAVDAIVRTFEGARVASVVERDLP